VYFLENFEDLMMNMKPLLGCFIRRFYYLINIGIMLEIMISHAKKGFLRTTKYFTDCNWQEVELDKDMISPPKMLGQLEG